MSDHSNESHEKLYWAVGGALFVLTVATVLVSKYHLPHPWGLVVGLAIAVLKASLVAAVFMHLKWEGLYVRGLLAITAFFAVFLFLLPIMDFHFVRHKVIHPADPAHQGPAHAASHEAPAAEAGR